MLRKARLIAGTLDRLLFSPKGGIEGLLLDTQEGVVQIAVPPEVGAALSGGLAAGDSVCFLATPDTSPKTAHAAHPVFEFESLANSAGTALPLPTGSDGGTAIEGVVTALHFARHGEPNGVLLAGGEFIHLKPHGMARLAPQVGDRITAHGELRMTILGTRMLEAHRVDDLDL